MFGSVLSNLLSDGSFALASPETPGRREADWLLLSRCVVRQGAGTTDVAEYVVQ